MYHKIQGLKTALHEASEGGHTAVVQLLLAHGANLFLTDQVRSILMSIIRHHNSIPQKKTVQYINS